MYFGSYPFEESSQLIVQPEPLMHGLSTQHNQSNFHVSCFAACVPIGYKPGVALRTLPYYGLITRLAT